MPTFTIGEQDFMLDGQPHRILSGALHYFRVHPDQWADRIRKARQMGLNTIETYIPWNAHAPSPEAFDATGGLDLGRFLDLVAAEGMHAIVRPGPYICAEWDNGGLPAWLFDRGAAAIRADDPVYMAAVTQYFDQLAPILVPRQVDVGGPIILIQIENEYGAYGADRFYLEKLVKINREIGLTVPFTTVDQPQDDMLANGSLPELHKTGSFGSRAAERLEILRRHQPTGPLMCSEFWVGWFDHWGAHHHTTTVEQSARDLDVLLGLGASVNIYMFHGGTNFGLTNGANDKGRYAPITTSYDYDAPLDESGHPTEKYWAFRDVIAKYAPVPDEVPAARPPAPALVAALEPGPTLLAAAVDLGDATGHERVPTFDELGHDRGIVVFSMRLDRGGPATLTVGEEVRDRAWVLVDGVPVGVLARDAHERAVVLPDARGELAIVVEDQGRVDYGARIGEHKGLIGGVHLDGVELTGWTARPIDLDRVPGLDLANGAEFAAGPVFAHGSLELDGATDLFLDTLGWGKGLVWVNGFLLGRYWRRGPQRTLIVPSPVTRAGRNDVVVLEFEAIADPAIRLLAAPELGHTEI